MTEPLRPLAQLLLDSVRKPAGLAVGEFDPRLFGLSVEQVTAAGSLHRVTPAVACRIEGEPGMPEEWRGALRSSRHAQLIRHLQARADLGVVQEALDEAGIRWVVVKGPVTSDLHWPRPDLREYFDLDLVVDRRRWTDTLQALEAAGCRYVDRNWPLLRQTMRAELAMTAPFGTPLDLHWDIAVGKDLRRSFAIDIAAMLSRRQPARLANNLQTWVLDPVDTVFHLAFHAALAGAGRLVWFADVWFAARHLSPDGWSQLRARARANRAEFPIALLIARAERLLGPIAGSDEVLDPTRSWWGRLVAARDRVYPPPGLPGDAHLGGTLFSSARPTLPGTVLAALRSRWRLRGLEKPGRVGETESDALTRDVPDDAARLSYQQRVQNALRP